MTQISLEIFSRMLISCSILLQLYSMISKTNIRVNSYAFLLYGIGALLCSYTYYVEDTRTFQYRTILKTINGIMLLIIGLYAYSYQNK